MRGKEDALLALPPELIIHVLSFVSFHAVVCVASLSRPWRNFVLSEPRLWQHVFLVEPVEGSARKTGLVVVAEQFLLRAKDVPATLRISSSQLKDRVLVVIASRLAAGKIKAPAKGVRNLFLLNCLSLTSSPFITSVNGLWAVLSSTLQRVSLQYCSCLTDDSLLLLIKLCNKLTHLHVSHNRCLTGIAFTHFEEWLAEKTNDVKRFTSSASKFPRICAPLVHIDLFDCKFLADTSITSMANTFHYLKSINIANNPLLTTTSLFALRVIPDGVRSLNISQLFAIEGPGTLALETALASVLDSSPQLTSFALNECRHFADESLTLLTMYTASTLLSLSIHSNVQLSSTALSTISECTKLQKLDLHSIPGIDDYTVAKIARACRSLTWLDISRSPTNRITNTALKSIGDWLQNLNYLNIAFCLGIGDIGVKSAILGAIKLTRLDLSGCEKIATDTIHWARETISNRTRGSSEVRYQSTEYSGSKKAIIRV